MEENCYVEPIYKNMPSTEQLQNARQLTLVVSGMGCPNCANRVHNKLISLEGVFGVDVYLHMALAVVIFDKNKLSPSQLITAVSQAGNDGRHEYRAELIPVQQINLNGPIERPSNGIKPKKVIGQNA